MVKRTAHQGGVVLLFARDTWEGSKSSGQMEACQNSSFGLINIIVTIQHTLHFVYEYVQMRYIYEKSMAYNKAVRSATKRMADTKQQIYQT